MSRIARHNLNSTQNSRIPVESESQPTRRATLAFRTAGLARGERSAPPFDPPRAREPGG